MAFRVFQWAADDRPQWFNSVICPHPAVSANSASRSAQQADEIASARFSRHLHGISLGRPGFVGLNRFPSR